ncbi:NAD(P)/FAD-dependent oxidoreductase [Rhodococcoides kroppenstedtii]|uniref:NAD(P)/FAD-dependent oxidoreductase n=1 Tax=Rhodococcoides kroppenstedtii TaxID=293050 RepID=UPI0028E690AC|nr:FAD-dependent oxidoreductase [Rhodococcus kroppenstedtii]
MAPTAHSTAYERHAPDTRVVEQSLAGARRSAYWLEDHAGDKYPTLTHDATADLVVVGGGYLGLWTAVLAKRRNPGVHVILLEGTEIGWAASGRNGGFCEASVTHGEENGRTRWPDEFDELDALGRENLDNFEKDVNDLGIDCQWERTGTLAVAVEKHQVEWIAGADDMLDAAEVRAQIDSPIFLGGVWKRDETAIVHPARLAKELARVAAELGVEIYEHSSVVALDTPKGGRARLSTKRALVTADKVVLATNIFPSLLKRGGLMTVPVYDYVLMTEPLSADQMDAIGWQNRQGLTDMANQFHYSRLSADNRILYGGYDAIYHAGGRMKTSYEDRPESYRRLASHFFATFPQLEGLSFTHKWGGVIDTSTQFSAFYGLARDGRVAYAAGFTGLGVGATRFAAEVLLDRISGDTTPRTSLEMVQKKPLPFPPEPLASIGINLTRWSLDRADHREGHRNLLLRTLDAVGLGFDS